MADADPVRQESYRHQLDGPDGRRGEEVLAELYEQFERELALPQSAANRAILDLVGVAGTLTDANAKRLVEQVQRAALDEARLNQKHFERLLKVLPAVKAARYMQIESKLQAVVRYETAKAIPLAQ